MFQKSGKVDESTAVLTIDVKVSKVYGSVNSNMSKEIITTPRVLLLRLLTIRIMYAGATFLREKVKLRTL